MRKLWRKNGVFRTGGFDANVLLLSCCYALGVLAGYFAYSFFGFCLSIKTVPQWSEFVAYVWYYVKYLLLAFVCGYTTLGILVQPAILIAKGFFYVFSGCLCCYNTFEIGCTKCSVRECVDQHCVAGLSVYTEHARTTRRKKCVFCYDAPPGKLCGAGICDETNRAFSDLRGCCCCGWGSQYYNGSILCGDCHKISLKLRKKVMS